MASRSFRDNNPGNIRLGPYAKALGAVDDGEGYAKFPDMAQGLAAMVRLLCGPDYRTLNIAEVIEKFAPREDHNDTMAYLKAVTNATGINPLIVFNHLDAYEIIDVIRAMIKQEGYRP